MLLRRPLLTALAVSAVLGVGAQVAAASPVGLPTGACATSSIDGQGRSGGNATQTCVGAGLVFIGPTTALSTVIGPTIITPAFTGISVASAGNVAIGP
jgi:hypothetical protein